MGIHGILWVYEIVVNTYLSLGLFTCMRFMDTKHEHLIGFC